MNTIDSWEIFIISFSNEKLITFFRKKQFLHKEYMCQSCSSITNQVDFKRHVDKFTWWGCYFDVDYKKYYSLRRNSFLENFTISLKDIVKILVKYAAKK